MQRTPLSKQRKKHLQTTLIEAAKVAPRYSPTLALLYMPVHDKTPLALLPQYVTDHILVDDGVNFYYQRLVDDLIYLYGSTCADEVGLTMTLAHELQHAIQHHKERKVWAVNSLMRDLPKVAIDNVRSEWADIPSNETQNCRQACRS